MGEAGLWFLTVVKLVLCDSGKGIFLSLGFHFLVQEGSEVGFSRGVPKDLCSGDWLQV